MCRSPIFPHKRDCVRSRQVCVCVGYGQLVGGNVGTRQAESRLVMPWLYVHSRAGEPSIETAMCVVYIDIAPPGLVRYHVRDKAIISFNVRLLAGWRRSWGSSARVTSLGKMGKPNQAWEGWGNGGAPRMTCIPNIHYVFGSAGKNDDNS